MSNRAVKKLKQRMQKKEDEEEEVAPQNVEFDDAPARKQNLFDLLDDEEESAKQSNDNDDDSEEPSVAAPKFISTSKNKKQKKKDAKKKKAQKEKEDEEFLEQEFQKSLSLQGASSADGSQQQSIVNNNNSKFNLLEIKDKLALNPDFEFKKIFGMQRAPATPSTPSSALKKTLLVTLKPNWPPYYNPGLSLSLVSTGPDASEIYHFDMSSTYSNIQRQFNIAIESHDPNNLVQLVHFNPFHVSTLMQLSEVYGMQGDRDVAQDFIERALFVLESSFTSAFSKAMLIGKARIPYYPIKNAKTEQEWWKTLANQQLYHVLLKRTHTLIATGCVTTALEYCKLMLQFSMPSDSAHILTFIDYVALRARQFQFLLDLIQALPTWYSTAQIAKLPNLMISKAFAYYNMEQAYEADKCLQEALKLWPMLLAPLVNQLSTQGCLQLSTWEPMLRNTIFTDLICSNRVCSVLMIAAVDRLAEVWKLYPQLTPQMVDWLKRNVQEVLKKPQQDEYAKQRSAVFADMKFINMYSDFSAAESTGKVLPPMGDPVSVNSQVQQQQQGSAPNPFMLFLSSLLPWNRANPQQGGNNSNTNEDGEEEIVIDD